MLGDTIRADIDLGFNFRCVNPRPPELEESFRVHWEVELTVIAEADEEEAAARTSSERFSLIRRKND